MSDTLLASASRMLWRTIDSYGIDADHLFIDAGLDPSRLNDPDCRYPVENARMAWSLAAQQLPEPAFGVYTGDHWLPTDLHALGFAFLSSPTLMNGLQRITRYNEIVDNVITFEKKQRGKELIMSYRNDREDLPDIPALEVGRWSVVTAMCRAARHAPFSPGRIELVQTLDGVEGAYRDYFGCEVIMGQPMSRLICPVEVLLEPLPAPNKGLAELNDRAVIDYLDRMHKGELSRKVVNLIRDNLATGNLSDELVAEAVFMSPRTLQRKLADEGTSYKRILQDVRVRLAEGYLKDARLSITEISFLLGFSEQSAFTRAFTRWTGASPSQTRQQMQGA